MMRINTVYRKSIVGALGLQSRNFKIVGAILLENNSYSVIDGVTSAADRIVEHHLRLSEMEIRMGVKIDINGSQGEPEARCSHVIVRRESQNAYSIVQTAGFISS